MTENNTLAYLLGDAMYINLTNLCTNSCVFCIRSLNDKVAGADLWLKDEDVTVEEVIAQIKVLEPEKRKEIVFCGYGEPLIKLEEVKQVAAFLKENYPTIPVRVNTNGHANLIHRRNVAPELKGLIDAISVSLNAENADVYAQLCECNFDQNKAYEAVKEFIAECVKNGIKTTATIVTGFKDYKVDVEKCREITESLGAEFRIREWLDEGYN